MYNGFWRRFKLEKNFPEITGRKIVAYFNFETAKDPELVVKVALSAVSTEGAVKNLRAEASGKSFEQLAEAARTDWNSELKHFEIEGTPKIISNLSGKGNNLFFSYKFVAAFILIESA